MGNRISSEDHLSSASIDIFINPSGPSVECPLVCFKDLESWVHMVTFLVIVFSKIQPNQQKSLLRSGKKQHSTMYYIKHDKDLAVFWSPLRIAKLPFMLYKKKKNT